MRKFWLIPNMVSTDNSFDVSTLYSINWRILWNQYCQNSARASILLQKLTLQYQLERKYLSLRVICVLPSVYLLKFINIPAYLTQCITCCNDL